VSFAGLDQRPTSVASFRLWWNKLHEGINIEVPKVVHKLDFPTCECCRWRVR
jgi:hypothetical protein